MKKLSKPIATILALSTGLGMAAWTPAAHACTYDPVMASMCVMAFPPGTRFQSFNGSYMLAQGQTLSVSQYTALYSLIGITYGGNATTTFQLPDLRGKVIVGYNPADPKFATGTSAGASTVKLTIAQLPQHAMMINLQVPMTGVTATTTMSGLAATADLSGVTISGEPSGLTIKATSTASPTTNTLVPTNNYLARPNSPAATIYSTATPDVTLNSASIGGTLSLTAAKGVTAPVTVTGNATTTLTGTATVSGATSFIGTGADVPVMPPYVAMPYYIAVRGTYPTGD